MKRILIIIGIIVVLIAAALFYMDYRNRTLSPPAVQSIVTKGGLEVNIDYSRPSVRDRLIFGEEADGALQPYGTYWRLGANEATVFEFSEEVTIAGAKIPAGKYGAYAFPGPENFDVGLNSTYDRWGYSEPDYTQDIVRFPVVIHQPNEHVEQFTISLVESENGVIIICEWDDVKFEIPVFES